MHTTTLCCRIQHHCRGGLQWTCGGGKKRKTKARDKRKHLQSRLVERKVTLNVDKEALEWLTKAGFDPAYGARPLKRVIQRTLQDPLALKLLEGAIGEGDTVDVTCNEGGLTIKTLS